MKHGNLKNMIVLKNLPSNIVEEAIVILKTNKKIKQIEKIDKEKLSNKDKKIDKEGLNNKDKENYIIKEAEMLISNYISKLEEKKKMKSLNNKKINKKYIRLKNYAFIASIIIMVESIILIIK